MKKYFFALIPAIAFFVFFPALAHGAFEISDGSVKVLYHLEDVSDSSGNSKNLTNNGSTAFSAGKLTNGADLNGSSNSLSEGTTNYIFTDTNSVLSISMWVKWDNVNDSNDMIFSSDGTNYYGYEIRYRDSGGHKKILVDISGSAHYVQAVSYLDSLTNGLFHHVVITYSGNASASGVNFYFDGILQAQDESTTNNTATSPTNTHIVIGASTASADARYFNGMVDELVVVDKVFSTGDVASLYNLGDGVEVCVAVGCGGGSEPTSTPTSTPPSSTSTTDFFNISPLDILNFLLFNWVYAILIAGTFGILLILFRHLFR